MGQRPVLNRIAACHQRGDKKRVRFKHIIVTELVGFLNDQPTQDLATQASVLEYL